MSSNIKADRTDLLRIQKVLGTLFIPVTKQNITYSESEIQTIGYDPVKKIQESINITIPNRNEKMFALNYDYDVTFINLRDIRFSQVNISPPFSNESEENIDTIMNNYPFKFYNYDKNNLVLLGMFGENDYSTSGKEKTSHPPTVPSLNVVKFDDSNCYVSIDNRRIELIYRQLCLLLSVNPKWCTTESMMLKNTNDFLRFELGIPNDVYIYIPCCIKEYNKSPPRQIKTPDGV